MLRSSVVGPSPVGGSNFIYVPTRGERVGSVHGGVKFYRGAAAAARAYIEADHSRADDYYLVEGTGLAKRYTATPAALTLAGSLDGDAYEQWVAGYDVDAGTPKGRLRHNANALRFVEVVVNGPKTWSIAAALDGEIAAAYDAAMDRAAAEVVRYVTATATTRVGPRDRQVQVPVELLEAAVVRHYTSRAGDPHRHLHLQFNARVFARGEWRGLHSVGVVDSIEAINGIGHAAITCDPEFRETLARNGYTLDDAGEIIELRPFTPAFSHRAAQIQRNIERYEAAWRTDHSGEEPGPRLRRGWDRRAWAEGRPDKVVPAHGSELVDWWNDELFDLGFKPPQHGVTAGGVEPGRIRRDAVAEVALSRLGARRSAWNSADVRGEVERLVASTGIVAEPGVRGELVADLVGRALARCVPLLDRDDVPAHIRQLTSQKVIDVEADLVECITARSQRTPPGARSGPWLEGLDDAQLAVVTALAGQGETLLLIEGAAGSGKTTTLSAAARALAADGRRLVVVTPTLKAAQIAQQQVGADGFSAAWLAHQHGYRWDENGRWSQLESFPDRAARLRRGDVLLVDEAGMLDQDTARAVFAIAAQARASIALLGDRHQLPAVGRGGVLDLAARWAPPGARFELDAVHRFTDPAYANLSLLMRTGERPGEVFDALLHCGQVVVHSSEVERTAALARIGTDIDQLIVADTHDQVGALNAAIRDRRRRAHQATGERLGDLVTQHGELIGVGDRITTRRNDRDLGVANRERWDVIASNPDRSLIVTGQAGERTLPYEYVAQHVELAYATTAYGAQGETVETAHLLLGETTSAASAYVGMTRGRSTNTAHLVADTVDDARAEWIEIFSRDRADLGPAHAALRAADDIDRYGSQARSHSVAMQAAVLRAARDRAAGADHAPGRSRVTFPGLGR
ncbi:AAA family ATPase [Nocardioides glacieisoli]|uniref:AAA family ATPase n=1 Tax=Nocardioides glacieisoli TaxID=1168730 RepID=A0A4Q2RMM6_9ACTN|nr:AAA family ATPase [Nocardioides glacieisoli]